MKIEMEILQRNHKVTSVQDNANGMDGMSMDSDTDKKKKKKEIDPRDRWTFDSEGKPIKMNAAQPKLGNACGSVFLKPEV